MNQQITCAFITLINFLNIKGGIQKRLTAKIKITISVDYHLKVQDASFIFKLKGQTYITLSRFITFLMKKKDKRSKNNDCYFESEEEDIELRSQQQQVKEEEMEIQDEQQSQQINEIAKDIESLNRIEIFQIFYESKNLKAIIGRNQDNYTIVNKLYWRIQYIFGQIIIMIQDYLISQNFLANSLKMEVKDIQCICQKLIQQADSQEVNEQFQEMKKQMWLVYRSNRLDSKIAIGMYNFCAKIWKTPIQFSLNFIESAKKEKTLNSLQGITYSNCSKDIPNSYEPREEKVTQPKQPNIPIINSPISILTADSSPSNNISTARIGPFSVTRMPVEFPNHPIKNTQNVNNNTSKDKTVIVNNKQSVGHSFSNPPISPSNRSISDQILYKQKQRYKTNINENNSFCMKASASFESQRSKQIQETKNCLSFGSEDNSIKKWSSKQEALFCQVYSKKDTSIGCQQQLEQLLGFDSRWKNISLIESKMRSLVNKVFNKFMTLETKNQSINVFKANRRMIMECNNQFLRRCIYKHIAIIYISMLYVNQSKKQEISRRIIQVNKLCKRINQHQQ